MRAASCELRAGERGCFVVLRAPGASRPRRGVGQDRSRLSGRPVVQVRGGIASELQRRERDRLGDGSERASRDLCVRVRVRLRVRESPLCLAPSLSLLSPSSCSPTGLPALRCAEQANAHQASSGKNQDPDSVRNKPALSPPFSSPWKSRRFAALTKGSASLALAALATAYPKSAQTKIPADSK